MRWLNADNVVADVGGNIQGYNLYAYCKNNPVNMTDESGHWPQWIKKAVTAVKNFFNPPQTVKNKVPLYKQGNTNLCWAYSQTMIESSKNGTKLTKKQADARAKEIAVARNGADNWNQAGSPSNIGTRIEVNSIEALYNIVQENGPVYARYCAPDAEVGHLIVVTGVSVYKNKVYTNNPWGKKGSQSFDSFNNGVAKKWYQDGQGMVFECIYLINE